MNRHTSHVPSDVHTHHMATEDEERVHEKRQIILLLVGACPLLTGSEENVPSHGTISHSSGLRAESLLCAKLEQ